MTAELRMMRERASLQYGLVRTEQAYEAGVSDVQLRNEVAHGRLRRVLTGLYEVEGAPHTTGWRAMAVVLGTHQSSALSHMTAASWWGLPGRPLRPWNVTRQRGAPGLSSEGVIVHEPRSFADHHVSAVRGIPVTTPARTVFDLAATASAHATESALDAFWVRGLVNHPQLTRMLEEVGGRGRAGTVLMRDLIDEREGTEFTPVESGLELRFAKVMRDAAMAPFEPQISLADEEGWMGRFDFVDEKRRIVVEVQSERYHSTLSDRRRDADRRSALESAGWLIVEVWDTDIWHRPDRVIQQVRDVRREAARRPRPLPV